MFAERTEQRILNIFSCEGLFDCSHTHDKPQDCNTINYGNRVGEILDAPVGILLGFADFLFDYQLDNL